MGRSAAIPSVNRRKLFDPSCGMTFAVAMGLTLAAMVIGGRLGWLGDIVPFRALTFAISALFALRAMGDFRYVGVFKRANDSAFAWWDSRLYSPLCLAIGAATFYLAYSPN